MEKVKIPASHLRAGNFHIGQDFRIPRLGIFSVKIDDNAFHAITVYGISLVETGLVEFNPIPLSENWLKKLGFKESGKENEIKKWWSITDFELIKNETSNFFYSTKANKDFMNVSIQIKWVHQLQNLYFALYQKELELVKGDI